MGKAAMMNVTANSKSLCSALTYLVPIQGVEFDLVNGHCGISLILEQNEPNTPRVSSFITFDTYVL